MQHSILWTAGIPVTFRCAYRMQTTTTAAAADAEAPHRAQVRYGTTTTGRSRSTGIDIYYKSAKECHLIDVT